MTSVYYIENSDFKSAKKVIVEAYSDVYDKVSVDTVNSYMMKSSMLPSSSILLARSTKQLMLTYENVDERNLNLELKAKIIQKDIVQKDIEFSDNDSPFTFTYKVMSKYWKNILLIMLCIGIPILIPFVVIYLLYKNRDTIKNYNTSIKIANKTIDTNIAEELENGIIDKATMIQAKAKGYNSEYELETNYIKLRREELKHDM